VLDTIAFRLSRGDRVVHAEPKALDVLLYLIERPGQLVSKDELKASVWLDTAVTDGALTRVIAQLRHALDVPDQQLPFIETVPTRGYRFVASVESAGCDRPVPIETVPERGRRTRAVVVASFAVSIALVAMFALSRRHDTAGGALGAHVSPAPAIRTIAVLPFKNLSPDLAQGYVAQGIAQTLSDTLSRFRVLDVVSTTSSFSYGSDPPPSIRIANELGADALIEGSVLRNDARLQVTIALVDGRSGRRLWTSTYDGDVADVLKVCEEIALQSASAIKVATDAVSFIRASSEPVDREAYDAYLRAMFSMGDGWMAGGCRKAEVFLNDAITHAPTFAPAYAALAWCYEWPDKTGRTIEEIGPKATAAVERALELDDRLAIGHTVAGTVAWFARYDPVTAERELRRGLDLDRNSALVLMPAATFFLWHGDEGTGMPLLDRVLALDPLSSDRHVAAAYALLRIGRYDEAKDNLHRALQLDPHNATARFWLAEIAAYEGQHEAAVSEYLKWIDMVVRPDRVDAVHYALADAFAQSGWTAFWTLELDFAEKEARHPATVWIEPYHRYAGSWYMARRHARLGHLDRAISELERSYRERSHLIVTMKLEPLFAPLRNDARFRDLLHKTSAPEDAGVTFPLSRSSMDVPSRRRYP
jgi:TolB-like protein/DNA-binding winged helix-turn-helix (wHTH) protein